MDNSKFTLFLKNYAGIIIGVIIGILIYFCDFLHNFFMFIFFVVISGIFGNYVQKNKVKVKDFLKNLIDKI